MSFVELGSKQNQKQNILFTTFWVYDSLHFLQNTSCFGSIEPSSSNLIRQSTSTSHPILQMDYQHLLNLVHDMPGYEYKWICAVCLINAKCGILLEFPLRDIDKHLFVYFDTDHTPWLMCRMCKHKFHLNCITSMSAEEQLATGDFVCCVWFQVC